MAEEENQGLFDVFRREEEDNDAAPVGQVSDPVYSEPAHHPPAFMIQRDKLPEYLKYQKKRVMVLMPGMAVFFAVVFVAGWFAAYWIGVYQGRSQMSSSRPRWRAKPQKSLSSLSTVSDSPRTRSNENQKTYYVYFILPGDNKQQAQKVLQVIKSQTGLELSYNRTYKKGRTYFWVDRFDSREITDYSQAEEILSRLKTVRIDNNPLFTSRIPLKITSKPKKKK